MATFVMLGRYSSQALKEMSAERTQRAIEIIEGLGGQVQSLYATLGEVDLVCIASLPSVEDAIKASVSLSKLTGIAFSTAPAVSVAEFDKLMG